MVICVVLKAFHATVGFMNIFNRRATGFHRTTKLFDLNFFIR